MGLARATVAPPLDDGHRLGGPLQHNLDPPIGKVASPAGQPDGPGSTLA